MEKVDVNGVAAHPVYRWLRHNGSENAGPIGWNFCTFMVSADGLNVVRFQASRSPSTIATELEAALAQAT